MVVSHRTSGTPGSTCANRPAATSASSGMAAEHRQVGDRERALGPGAAERVGVHFRALGPAVRVGPRRAGRDGGQGRGERDLAEHPRHRREVVHHEGAAAEEAVGHLEPLADGGEVQPPAEEGPGEGASKLPSLRPEDAREEQARREGPHEGAEPGEAEAEHHARAGAPQVGEPGGEHEQDDRVGDRVAARAIPGNSPPRGITPRLASAMPSRVQTTAELIFWIAVQRSSAWRGRRHQQQQEGEQQERLGDHGLPPTLARRRRRDRDELRVAAEERPVPRGGRGMGAEAETAPRRRGRSGPRPSPRRGHGGGAASVPARMGRFR